MLKSIHITIGAIALLLAFIPSIRNEALFLQQSSAIALALIGLLNLQFAPSTSLNLSNQHRSLVLTSSVLLVFATLLAAVAVFSPSLHPAFFVTALALAAGSVAIFLATLKQPRSVDTSPIVETPEGREAGMVKWFNTSKGFGFISRDSGEDIFVHFRAIRGDGHRILSEGQRVEFTVVQRDKGLQAEDVAIL